MFIAGGFAEINETRVTVLAEEAIAVADLTSEDVQARTAAAEAELAAATTEYARREAARHLAIAQAMRAALA